MRDFSLDLFLYSNYTGRTFDNQGDEMSKTIRIAGAHGPRMRKKRTSPRDRIPVALALASHRLKGGPAVEPEEGHPQEGFLGSFAGMPRPLRDAYAKGGRAQNAAATPIADWTCTPSRNASCMRANIRKEKPWLFR